MSRTTLRSLNGWRRPSLPGLRFSGPGDRTKIAATSPNYVEPKPAQKPENPSVTFAKQYGTFGGEALPAQKTIAAPAAPKAVPAATEAVVEKPAAVKAEAVSQANPADTAEAPKPAAGGKAKFDKEAMLAKIREKKANK